MMALFAETRQTIEKNAKESREKFLEWEKTAKANAIEAEKSRKKWTNISKI